MYYKNWDIDKDESRNISGNWRARERITGITMCAGSEEAVKQMIDVKMSERKKTYNLTGQKAKGERTWKP